VVLIAIAALKCIGPPPPLRMTASLSPLLFGAIVRFR
jgi:hypothetical protein